MSTIYEVLRRPLVTEKSNYQSSQLHQYVFEVAQDANRTQVKDAIEQMFSVTVTRVNLINVAAKRSRKSRSRKWVISRPGYKKAIVTLAPDDRLPIFEGVE
jgi:large subunit ribosomal protein L23